MEKIEPWQYQNLNDRKAVFQDESALRVAYFHVKPSPSTFRYRAFNMVEAVSHIKQGGIAASWFSMSEVEVLFDILPRLDLLVIVRVPFCSIVAELIAWAKLLRVKIVFDCDDLVFDPKYAYLAAVNNGLNVSDSEAIDGWFSYVGRLNATAQHCDAGLSTNAFLAEKLASVICGPVQVIHNFLNYRQEQVSKKLVQDKINTPLGKASSRTIGFFSGSKTHQRDLELIEDPLLQFLGENEDIKLHLVGYIEPTPGINKIKDRVIFSGFVPWLSLQEKISGVDLNIAPLQGNAFSHAKSELKYFEAAIVGTFSCVSHNFCFEGAVRKSKLGVIADPNDWFNSLEKSFDALSSVPRTEIIKRLEKYALENWGSTMSAQNVAKTLHSFLK